MPVAEPVPRFDPRRHHRRSVRLRHHDYTGSLYFVTICTHGRVPLFGEIADGEMASSVAGDVAWACWLAIPDHFPHVVVDAFVVMPNHVHGILGIADGPFPTDGVGAQHAAPLRSSPPPRPVDRGGRCNVAAGSLPAVVRAFKAAVTRRINRESGTPGAAVWQRNYWERVLRDGRELGIARRYVADNPLRWHRDRLHPDRIA
jgi:REP element-mobilizing transposase RayT